METSEHTSGNEFPVSLDATYVARVLAGDVEAYATLIAAHRHRCLRYAYRMLGDLDEAEDVTQETFVRAFRSLAKCQDPARFGAWLFKILVNRCRTAAEKRRRWGKLVTREPESNQWAEPPAEHTTSANDVRDELWEVKWALNQLNTTLREAFVLKYVDELSYEEMALVTGVSVSALKMRVSRACDAVRTHLLENSHA